MALFLARPEAVGHFAADGRTRLKIQALSVSPDGKRLATAGGDNKIKLWKLGGTEDDSDTNNDADVSLLWASSVDNEIRGLQWSPDGHFLASGDALGLVSLWTKQAHAQDGGHRGAFDSNAKDNVETWKCIATYRGHSMDITGLSWAPGSNMIASSSIDNSIRVWPVRDEMRTRALNLVESEPVAVLKGHEGWAMGVAWDPVGRYIASVGNDKFVIIWRCGDWKLETKVKGPFPESESPEMRQSLSWSPDGVFLSMSHAYDEPRHVGYVIERNKWKDQESSVRLVGHSAPITACNFSPCIYSHGPRSPKATICAITCEKATLTLWTPGNNRPLLILRKLFDRKVQDMSWSGDGSTLVLCSSNGAVACLGCSNLESHEHVGPAISKTELTDLLNEYYGEEDLRQSQPSIPETPLQFRLEARARGGEDQTASATSSDARPSEATLAGGQGRHGEGDDRSGLIAGERSTSNEGAASAPATQLEARMANGKRRITPVAINASTAVGTTTQPHVLVPRRRGDPVGGPPSSSAPEPRPASPLSSRMPPSGNTTFSTSSSSTTPVGSAEPPSGSTESPRVPASGGTSAAPSSSPLGAGSESMLNGARTITGRLVVASRDASVNERDRVLRSAKRPRVWATRTFFEGGSGQVRIRVRRVKAKGRGLFGPTAERSDRVESVLTLAEAAGAPAWTATVRGRACAVASNNVFTACATREADLYLFGVAGETLLLPIRLPCRVAGLAAGGPNSPYLGCVTCDGRLRIWNVSTLTATVSDAPLDPLWARSSGRPRRIPLRSLIPAVSRFTTEASRRLGLGIFNAASNGGRGSRDGALEASVANRASSGAGGDEEAPENAQQGVVDDVEDDHDADDTSASEDEGGDDESGAEDAHSEGGHRPERGNPVEQIPQATVAAFGVTPEGVAVLILAEKENLAFREECAAFAFEAKMRVWVRIADVDEYIASDFHSSLSLSLSGKDARVLASLRHATIETGRAVGLASARASTRARDLLASSADGEGGNGGTSMSTRHAGALCTAALVLQRPSEYKEWLEIYARQLASEGDHARLRALCDALLGAETAANASNTRLLDALSATPTAWQSELLDGQLSKRGLLRDVVVPAIASNRQLQKLAADMSRAVQATRSSDSHQGSEDVVMREAKKAKRGA